MPPGSTSSLFRQALEGMSRGAVFALGLISVYSRRKTLKAPSAGNGEENCMGGTLCFEK